MAPTRPSDVLWKRRQSNYSIEAEITPAFLLCRQTPGTRQRTVYAGSMTPPQVSLVIPAWN
jgi:hypothetical protein